MSTAGSVSLIICSRGRPDLLAETVQSVLSGEVLPTEIIIVDQSDVPHPTLSRRSSSGTCEVRYYHEQSVGLCRARNAGVQAARFPVLVFTDDDVLVSQGWFRELVRALQDEGEAAVVTGQVLPAEDKSGGFVPTLKACSARVSYSGRVRSDPLTTFNMALHRTALKEAGGFDVRLGPGTPYPAGEDNELAFRILERGIRIVTVPEAVLYHRAWREKREYIPLRWRYGRGQGAFFAKHLKIQDVFMARRLAGTVLHLVLSAPVQLLRAEKRPGRNLPRHILAAGELAFAVGTLSGALDWLLRYRIRGVKRSRPEDVA